MPAALYKVTVSIKKTKADSLPFKELETELRRRFEEELTWFIDGIAKKRAH